MMKNIVFIIFVLISQLVFSESASSELFCDASKVQNKDWTIDIKGYQQENYNKIFLIWLSKAEKGNPKYQFYTAQAYYFGDGVTKDIKKAVYWYKKSSEQGYPIAKKQLSLIYESGKVMGKDLNLAFTLLCDAAMQGELSAQYWIGIRLLNGKGIKQNDKRAFEWIEIASKSGSARATKILGFLYRLGRGVDKDGKKSFKWSLEASKEGMEQYYGQVGLKYMNGKGVDVDLKRAAFWLYKSYKNNPDSFIGGRLAVVYFKNRSESLPEFSDLSKTFIYKELLPELTSMDLMAVAFELHSNIISLKDAVVVYELSAEKGSFLAMNMLGLIYTDFTSSYGEIGNIEKAIYWLEKSSKKVIGSNLALSRIYFGLHDFHLSASYIDLQKAYKYSSQAVDLIDSGKAIDQKSYQEKTDIMGGIYLSAAGFFSDRGMSEISEGLIRKYSENNPSGSLKKDNLRMLMLLSSLSKNQEKFENIYQAIIDDSNSDFTTALKALFKLSQIYRKKGDGRKHINFLLSNYKKIANKNTDLSPVLLLDIAFVYLSLNNIDKAEEYLTKYKNAIKNISKESSRILKFVNSGEVGFLESAIDMSRGVNVDKIYAKMKKSINYSIEIDQSSGYERLGLALSIIENFISANKINYAYEISKPIIEAYKNNFKERLLKGIKISRQEKNSIKNVLSNFIYVAEKTNKTELDFGFEIMQLAAGLDASDALVKTIYKRKMGLSNTSIIDKLENLRLKKKMTIREKLSKITLDDSELLDVDSKLNSIDREIDAAQKEITKKGLNSNSINLFVSSTQDVIDTLRKQDALLTMLVSKERTFVWLVTSNGVYRHHANVGSNTIEIDVEKLLYSLDPNKRGSSKFPLESSLRLYDLLIGPFEQELKGIDRLVIVPDSILSGIPFSILNDSEGENIGGKLTYIDASLTRGIEKAHTNISTSNVNENNWLINKFAISIVPSIYSYIESAKLSNAGADSKDSFLGIGNPALTGTIDQVSKNQLIAHVNTRGSVSKFVSKMTPLPETEKELSLIAKSFSKSDLIFGKEATEKRLQDIDLSQYSVISFATHALVSNEIEGIVEPSLILTPVDENNPNNDGLLTASEISNLKLDAEIVLLSACNTASAFGESNSQGLSGLANSFFNAGARSLLVSYWSVISESAVDITTRIFKPSNEGRSYAHKHRNAVLDLLQNSKDTYKLHPSYWAPFSVIGVN